MALEKVKLDHSISPYKDFVEIDGYDIEDVKKELGDIKFRKFQDFMKTRSVFVIGHRKDDKGFDVHCVYSKDLAEFLKAGGQ